MPYDRDGLRTSWVGCAFAIGLLFFGRVNGQEIVQEANPKPAADPVKSSEGDAGSKRQAGSIGSYSELRAELLAMMEEDQRARIRAQRTQGGKQIRSMLRIRSIDMRNTKRMKQIVDLDGWPTRTKVGQDGAHAAWLLVQHADHDVAFQRRCLELMEPLVTGRAGLPDGRAGLPDGRTGLPGGAEVSSSDVAYLTDRVLINEGKLQVYGTQFHAVIIDGKPFGKLPGKPTVPVSLVPQPMIDPEHVDKRRKAMGLSTLAEYAELMNTLGTE